MSESKRPKLEEINTLRVGNMPNGLDMPANVICRIGHFLDWDEALLLSMSCKAAQEIVLTGVRRVLRSLPASPDAIHSNFYVHEVDFHVQTMTESLILAKIFRNSRLILEHASLSVSHPNEGIDPLIQSNGSLEAAGFQQAMRQGLGLEVAFPNLKSVLFAGENMYPHVWVPGMGSYPSLERMEWRPWKRVFAASCKMVWQTLAHKCPNLHHISMGDKTTIYVGDANELKKEISAIPQIQSVSFFDPDYQQLWIEPSAPPATVVAAFSAAPPLGVWVDFGGSLHNHKSTLLSHAVMVKNWPLVEYILNSCGVPLSETKLHGNPIEYAALQLADYSGCPAESDLTGLSLFLSHGLDICAVVPENPSVPLWQEFLLRCPTQDMFKLLFQTKVFGGQTAFAWSASCRSDGAFALPSSILELFCSSERLIAPNEYYTPLLTFLFRNRSQIEAETGLAGLIGFATDRYGMNQSLLTICHRPEMAQFLLDHGTDPNFSASPQYPPAVWLVPAEVLQTVISCDRTDISLEVNGVTLMQRELSAHEPREAVLMKLLERGSPPPEYSLNLDRCVTIWLASYFQNQQEGIPHPSSPSFESIVKMIKLIPLALRPEIIAPPLVLCHSCVESELVQLFELLDEPQLLRVEKMHFYVKKESLIDLAATHGFSRLLEYLIVKLGLDNLKSVHRSSAGLKPIELAITGSISSPNRIDAFIACANICIQHCLTDPMLGRKSRCSFMVNEAPLPIRNRWNAVLKGIY